MNLRIRRSLISAACLGLLASAPLSAETIIKLELGVSGPDVQYVDGEISTVNDGNLNDTSPGDRDTDATFLGFVSDAGIPNIPENASFTLSGISAVGEAVTFGSLVNQSTTGGTFELFDTAGDLLLSGALTDGVLTGPSSASGVSTGSLFTVNLGTFTGPDGEGEDQVFKLLAPNTAQLSMSFTNVNDGAGQTGFSVLDGALQNFETDVTAQIAAEASGNVLTPEPNAVSLLLFGLLGVIGFRRRR